jgi:hypothetical protein
MHFNEPIFIDRFVIVEGGWVKNSRSGGDDCVVFGLASWYYCCGLSLVKGKGYLLIVEFLLS